MAHEFKAGDRVIERGSMEKGTVQSVLRGTSLNIEVKWDSASRAYTPADTLIPETPGGVYLELFHGRTDPSQDMDDLGTRGPVFGPLQFVHTTYNCEIKLGIPDDNADILSFHDDMVYYDGAYYGDWSVFSESIFNASHDLKSRLTPFDEAKCKEPRPAPLFTVVARRDPTVASWHESIAHITLIKNGKDIGSCGWAIEEHQVPHLLYSGPDENMAKFLYKIIARHFHSLA